MKVNLKLLTMPFILLLDMTLVLVALLVGFLARFDGMLPEAFLPNLPIFWAILSFLLLASGMAFRCYYNVWQSISVTELLRQVMSVTVTFLCGYVLNSLLNLHIPRGVELFAYLFTLMGTCFFRLLPRLLLWVVSHFHKTPSNRTIRVLIVGAGESGTFLAHRLMRKAGETRVPIGFVDDNPHLWNRWINAIPVFGGVPSLNDVVTRHQVKEVIIAIHSADKALLQDIFSRCSNLKVKVSLFDAVQTMESEPMSPIRIREVGVEELLGREPVHLSMESVMTLLKDSTVLVTGGAGSIGSELCRQALAYGCKSLVIFDFHENGLFDIDNELRLKYGADRYHLVLGSIRDEKRLDDVFRLYRPDFVFHAAAHKHVPMMEWNPLEAIKNNVFGTWYVAKAADAYGVRKMILISTDKAVNPTNIMGASKRCAELVLQMMDHQSETEFAAVRFGNVLGSNGSVVPFFKSQIAAGGPVTVTHPDILRYFMTIPESVQLVLQAGAMAKGGELFVLDMGEPVKILDLAVALIQLSGLEPYKDIQITFTGLRPGEKMFEELRIKGEDIHNTDNNKIFVMQQETQNVLKTGLNLELMQKAVRVEQREQVFLRVQELVPTFVRQEGQVEDGVGQVEA
jgi:FlaA1/EpsC-like NDP-sugar epimerase